MPKQVEVTGVAENMRALENAAKINTEKAGHQAVVDLLPFVKQETRYESGALRAGWEAQENAFVNDVDYAGYQEFGTMFVQPTGAIEKSVERHEEVVRKPFDKETDDAARKAGFSR